MNTNTKSKIYLKLNSGESLEVEAEADDIFFIRNEISVMGDLDTGFLIPPTPLEFVKEVIIKPGLVQSLDRTGKEENHGNR